MKGNYLMNYNGLLKSVHYTAQTIGYLSGPINPQVRLPLAPSGHNTPL